MFCLRFFLSVAVMLALCFPVFSQEHILLRYSNTEPVSKADSVAIMELIRKSRKFEYTNIDTAIIMVNEALQLSMKLKFGYGIGHAYITYSMYTTTQGHYHESNLLLKKAYPYCINQAGLNYDTRLLALWYGVSSYQAAYDGEYQQSANLAFAGLNLMNQRPDDTTLITQRTKAYNTIGSILQHLNQPQQAFYYLDKGLTLAMQQNDTLSLAQLYVNYGNASSLTNQWAQATRYYHKAIALCKEHNYLFVQQIAYLSIASMYRNTGQYDSAITYLKTAISLSDKTNPYLSKITPYQILGEVYINQKEYTNAIQYGKMALSLSEQLNTPQNIAVAHGLLAAGYGGTKQWEKAYMHQAAYTRLLDSVRGAGTLANINQLEVKSRVAEKDMLLTRQQLSLNQKESALREKNFWIAGALTCTLLLVAFLFSVRRNYSNKQKLQERTKEIDRLKATMDGAEQERKRIAVELHDGIVSQLWGLKLNLTTTINKQQEAGSLLPADFKESLSYLDDTMNDLRYTAHNLSPEMALQSGLPKALADFCHKMNNQGDTDVHFQIYGQARPTDKNAALSIFRAVQELVQNALKHAKAATILVQLNCEEDITGVTVQDDGQGFDITNRKLKTGMGLHSVTERIQTLKGDIDIQSNEAGTSIYMEFKNKNIEDIKI